MKTSNSHKALLKLKSDCEEGIIGVGSKLLTLHWMKHAL